MIDRNFMYKPYEERLCLFAEFFIKNNTIPSENQTENMGLKNDFRWKFENQLDVKGVDKMKALCLKFLNKRDKDIECK